MILSASTVALTRLGVGLAFLGVGALAWRAVTRTLARRVALRAPDDALLAAVPAGTAGIVYFSSTTCGPCRLQQQPALDALAAEWGLHVAIVSVDAARDTDAASRWGVFSVPTTFVFGPDRQLRYVNRGVATAETLARQLSA